MTYADDHVPVVEDSLVDHGFRGDGDLVPGEKGETDGADNEREEDAPGGPVVHDTTGGESEEKSSHARGEDGRADIVESLELLGNSAGNLVLVQEEDHEHKSEAGDGQVDIEDPSPANILGEASTNQRTGHGADRPHGREEREPLASNRERDQISHDDLEGEIEWSIPTSYHDKKSRPHLGPERDVPL